MSQIEIYVKADNLKYYRCPIITGDPIHQKFMRAGVEHEEDGHWFIRFDIDCPRLVIERTIKPLKADVVLGRTGISAYLTSGRGKSDGYQSFTFDQQNHTAALAYEIRLLRPVPAERIHKHLGCYDDLSGAADTATVYK